MRAVAFDVITAPHLADRPSEMRAFWEWINTPHGRRIADAIDLESSSPLAAAKETFETFRAIRRSEVA